MEFGEEECNIYSQNGLHVEKKRQKRATTSASEKRCTSCGTTSTPVWRWGGEAKDTLLCNACSLRIRRSAVKPGRAKSPGDRVTKRAAHSSAGPTTSDSGPHSADDRDALSGGVPLEEDGLFRQRLHGLVLKERDRLLGSWSTLSPEDQWSTSPWTTMSPLSAGSGGQNVSPDTPRHREWETYRVFSGLSDTSRLDFGQPPSPYGLGESRIY